MNETRLYTGGYLSATLQISVQEIEDALRKTGYTPALWINGVAHWGQSSLDHLRKQKCAAQLESIKNFLAKEGV